MQNIVQLDKPFKKGDVILYAVLIALSVCLFIAVAFSKNVDFNGFTVQVEGQVVAVCNFDSKSFSLEQNSVCQVENLGNNSYKLITKHGYNTIKVDFEQRTVAVVETDCGYSKECTHMNFADGSIICLPHSVVISPSSNKKGGLVIG